jgi:hypothetical protein
MIGTLINTATVGLGSLLGLAINQKLPKRFVAIVFQVLGIFTAFIGIKMALDSANMLILVLSLLVGALLGESANLEKRANNLAGKLGEKTNNSDGKFAEGFVTAFMLFCVGAMTTVGCIQEGLTGNREVIITKSIMDFFSSTALASAFGKGVLFSAIALFIYQGALTLSAGFLEAYLSQAMQDEMNAAGGLMLVGLGLNILEIKKIRVLNFLPALVIAPVLTALAEYFEIYLL